MSSADRDDARLPARAEALLSEWPVPEKDDQAWEERAKAIEAKLVESPPKSSAELLRPPFPSSPDEDGDPQRASSPKLTDIARAVRESKPDQNLTDIARAARGSKPELTEIAKESLSLASQARAAAPEVAARVRAAQAGRSPADATPMPQSASAAPPAPSTRPAEASPDHRRTPLIALVAGGLALAAAVALVVRSKSEAPASVAHEPAAVAPAASAAPVAPPAAAEPGIAVEDLPGVGAESKVAGPAPKAVASKAASASKPEPVAALEKAAPAQAPSPAQPQASAQDPELKPADGRMGLPEKPTTGAVQVALGSVIGGARSCVSGQDRPSSATIVFGSDGRVQSVVVTGAAAGTPAAGCIRSALEKARVHPFAKPTFSASATIRPH
jgi:hypothetical protein